MVGDDERCEDRVKYGLFVLILWLGALEVKSSMGQQPYDLGSVSLRTGTKVSCLLVSTH